MSAREDMLANFEEFLDGLSEDELESLSCEHFCYHDGEVSDEPALTHNTFVCSTASEDSELWFTQI